MNIAFVTDREHLDFAEDDRLVVSFLRGHGESVTPAVWDDPDIEWELFDVIIFRSVWDYFIRIKQFDAWLKQLENVPVRVFNPLSIVEWNKDKTYFDHFSNLGIAIPAYQILKSGSHHTLSGILQLHGWTKAVIKPTVSGGAYRTWVSSDAQAGEYQQEFESMLAEQDVIVQKFAQEIIDRGECSLIFFNKIFSHAICKKARSGEFRVQAQYGGSHTSFVPDEKLLNQVRSILDTIKEPLLYARVDGYLDQNERFYLMELELIEPVLFFDSDPEACANFYHALKQLMQLHQVN